ncbi:MAG: hypothetical protein K0S53_2683 [Bacteroidetes bacterium]|jgi:hypothetical protein|nr:hypothetical protein [Bacteroidota bacterium]
MNDSNDSNLVNQKLEFEKMSEVQNPWYKRPIC